MNSEKLAHQKEVLEEDIKGVAGVVISNDGKIIVGTEQLDKPETQKERGQISIPLESLKGDEVGKEDRMFHALLTEIATDSSIDRLNGYIRRAGETGIVEVAPGISVAVIVLLYDGDSSLMPFEAPHPEEFSDLRWVEPQMLDDPDQTIRPFTLTIIDYVKRRFENGDTMDFREINLDGFLPSIYDESRKGDIDVILDGTTEN